MLDLQLVEKLRGFFRAPAIDRAPQLLDLKLQMRDEGIITGKSRPGFGAFDLGLLSPCFARNPRSALGEDHRMRGSKIGWEQIGCRRSHEK